MREPRIFAGVVVALAGLGTLWFLQNFERVDVDERSAPSALVQSNSNYGFSQFLKTYDIESQQLPSLNTRTQMPDTSDTLVVNFDAVYLTEDETIRLANWVTAGGHLVVPLPYDSEDTLLAYFNIHSDSEDEDVSEQTNDTESPGGTQEENQGEMSASTDEETESESDNANSEPNTEPAPEDIDFVYDAGFNGDTNSQLSMSYKVYDDLYSNRETLWSFNIERETEQENVDKRTYALGFQYGLGSISLLSDYAQWNNDNFFKEDNAKLSLAMLSQVRPTGKIWFVQTIRRLSLWQTVWKNAAHLLLWLGLGILLFFWWAGQRLGRILPNPSLQRREFNEHLIASGRFLWSNKKRHTLLNSAQDALRMRIRQRYPRLHTLNEAQTKLHLQDILEDRYATWTFAMKQPESLTKPIFLDQIRAIQTLWKTL